MGQALLLLGSAPACLRVSVCVCARVRACVCVCTRLWLNLCKPIQGLLVAHLLTQVVWLASKTPINVCLCNIYFTDLCTDSPLRASALAPIYIYTLSLVHPPVYAWWCASMLELITSMRMPHSC